VKDILSNLFTKLIPVTAVLTIDSKKGLAVPEAGLQTGHENNNNINFLYCLGLCL